MSFYSSHSKANSQTKVQQKLCNANHKEYITNYCAYIDCLCALCPECIQGHIEFHQTHNSPALIQSISNTKVNCEKKIQAAIANLQKEIDQCDIQYVFDPDELIRIEVKKMEEAKYQMNQLIDLFFQQQEEILRTTVKENCLKVRDLGGIFTQIKELVAQLEGLKRSVQSSQDPFPYISKTCKLDVKSMVDKYRSEIKKIVQTRELDPITVHINDHRLFALKNELQKIVRVITQQGQDQEEDDQITKSIVQSVATSSVHQSQVSNHPVPQVRPDSPPQPQPPKPTQQARGPPPKPQHAPVPMGLPANSGPFIITKPNFYQGAAKPILHFFKNNDTQLCVLDLSQLNLKFQTIKLNINFTIPHFHRSVVSPQGDIYISGGRGSDGKKDGMIHLACMSVGRSSHTMVYCNGYIYCLGGFILDKIVSPSMERYNIAQQHFEGCAEAFQAANSPTCCVFEDKYIYKFGGNQEDGSLVQIIERYNIGNNIWEHIDPKLDHNEIENFHGMLLAHRQMRIASWYLEGMTRRTVEQVFPTCSAQKDQEQARKRVPSFKLISNHFPSLKDSGIVVIQNKRFYVLQNVEVEENQIDESRRQILCFDGNKWTDLGDGL